MLPLHHRPSNQCSHNARRYHKCTCIYILAMGEGNPELLTQCLPWLLYGCMRELSNSSIATSLYITHPDTQQLLAPWTMSEICTPICWQLKQYRSTPWLAGRKGQLINSPSTHTLPGRQCSLRFLVSNCCTRGECSGSVVPNACVHLPASVQLV